MGTYTQQDIKKRFVVEDENGFRVSISDHYPLLLRARDLKAKVNVILKVYPRKSINSPIQINRDTKKTLVLKHPHLLSPRELADFTFQLEKEDIGYYTALVFDEVKGGNLRDWMNRKLKQDERERIISGMLLGLKALHSKQVIHGKLKPSNILIQDLGHPHVRLIDYGFFNNQKAEGLNVNYKAGGIKYFAPEMISPEIFAKGEKIGKAVDFWALGVLLYELFTGKYPFADEEATNEELAVRICYADIPADLGEIPLPYRRLVKACLHRLPKDRPQSIEEIQKLLLPLAPSMAKEVKNKTQKEKNKREKTEAFLPFLNTKKKSIPRQKPKSKPLAHIVCRSCGTTNSPKKVFCQNCKAPLSGPEYLRKFRPATAIGLWSIAFLILTCLPIVFFYKWFFDSCDFSSGYCDMEEVLQNFFTRLEQSQSQKKEKMMLLIPLIFMIITGVIGYIFYFWWLIRSSKNLEYLGSKGRRYLPIFLIFAVLLSDLGLPALFKEEPALLVAVFFLAEYILSLMTLQEIWKGSNPAFTFQGEAWKKGKGSFLIFS